MGAGHDHSHGMSNERGLRIALALTGSFLIAEVVGAFATNSLALLSDAAHMLTDVAALIIALVALRLARRPADTKRTFGYYRAEILAAVLNAVLLFLAAVYILSEAYRRFQSPPEIETVGMLVVAVIGLLVNLVSMRVLRASAESSLNMKAAYLEVWSDALGSIGVIIAALTIRFTGWWQADPIVAVLIGLWVLPRTWTLLTESINVLLEGVPQGIELDAIHGELKSIPGVADVHDLHVWSITTGKNTLTAHLMLESGSGSTQKVLSRAREVLEKRFGISHSTVQVETGYCVNDNDCGPARDATASGTSPREVQRHFEFGETEQANAFLDRHPGFYSAFERLMNLANSCFGRTSTARNRAEDVCFSLGHTCREDYLEILFLAVNAYGGGASKLLRGLYERGVTLAFIEKHTEKAERFVHFAAIQEHKLMNAALEMVSEDSFNEAMKDTENTVEKIKERYRAYKAEFETTLCRDCGRKGTAFSWDRDLVSMVRDVGEPYKSLYVGSYALANLHVHATLASMLDGSPTEIRWDRTLDQADFALLHATFVFLEILRQQSRLFHLELDLEIEACEKEFASQWVHSAGTSPRS